MKMYHNKNGKLLYCPCRKKFLQYTPEEVVRQKLLKYLINDMGIPADSIDTEYPLSHMDASSKQRADIVVWYRNREGKQCPLLVLELKAEHIPLTDQTLDQVKSYNQIIKAKYMGISNGTSLYLYEVKKGEILPLTYNLYTYHELLHGKVEYFQFRKMTRLPYELTTYDRYVDFIYRDGYIGEGTPIEMHPFLAELQNFILCENIQFKHRFKISMVEDLGTGIFTFGSASGGNFTGYYRSFIIKDLDGNHSIYRIGMFGTDIMTNDPIYGNRSGNTYLTVGTDDSKTAAHVLQLNMDQFFKYDQEKDHYVVTHNGRRNGYKNSQVIEYVHNYCPNLLSNETIYLGELPARRSITMNDGSEFIERILAYANVREKLNKKKKKRKKTNKRESRR